MVVCKSLGGAFSPTGNESVTPRQYETGLLAFWAIPFLWQILVEEETTASHIPPFLPPYHKEGFPPSRLGTYFSITFPPHQFYLFFFLLQDWAERGHSFSRGPPFLFAPDIRLQRAALPLFFSPFPTNTLLLFYFPSERVNFATMTPLPERKPFLRRE